MGSGYKCEARDTRVMSLHVIKMLLSGILVAANFSPAA